MWQKLQQNCQKLSEYKKTTVPNWQELAVFKTHWNFYLAFVTSNHFTLNSTIMLRYHGSIAEYFNFSRMQNFSYFILPFTFFILLKFFHSPKMKQNITQFKSMDKCQNLLTSTSKQIRIKRNSRKKNLKCHRVLKSLSPS